MQSPGQPLRGNLVVDFTRYLPGAYASRELLRLGARVVRVEPPGGDPMRATASAWDDALRAGSESVVCDLPADGELARRLCARADVVLESFRPGVAELCELLGRPELAARQYGDDQETLAAELGATFAERALDDCTQERGAASSVD